MNILEIADFSASYNKNTDTLSNINLSFAEGSFNCIIGENGSGKSTLLSALCGIHDSLLIQKKGSVKLYDKLILDYSAKEKAKLISFLPQTEKYTWNFTVEEVVLMGRYAHSEKILGYSEKDKDYANRALDICGILHLKDRNIFELSGGEYQQVLIARSLAQETKILVLDEPFTFLDISKQKKLLEFLKNLSEKENFCVIISIHEINLAPIYASNLILLKNGKILAQGEIPKVFTKENLNQAYNCNFELFEHPFYRVPQVY